MYILQQQQQYFITLQLILNPLAPQAAVLIEGSQDNHTVQEEKKRRKYTLKATDKYENRLNLQKQLCN